MRKLKKSDCNELSFDNVFLYKLEIYFQPAALTHE